MAMTEQEFKDALVVLQRLVADHVDRRAALDALRRADFEDVGGSFPRARYLDALRGLIGDRLEEVRRVAVETLAHEKDAFIQDRLLAGLRTADAAIVPRARAIQLLSYDSHGPHVPACRSIAANRSEDDETRIEALRALGGDPESEETLQRVMAEPGESLAVRMWAGASLRALSPPAFARLADRIRHDATEHPRLKEMCAVAFRTSPTLSQLL